MSIGNSKDAVTKVSSDLKRYASECTGDWQNGSTNRDYILIVDDDAGLHVLLGHILRPLQLEVRCALDGTTALDMVAAHRPSLIILDLRMPGLDGFSVLERLGEGQTTASIPVVVYSANTGLAHRSDYEWPTQVVKVLIKTKVRPMELRDLVRDQLSL
jgi:CheY-like chemotaxis protein